MEKIMKTRRIVIAVLSIIAVAVIGVGAFLFMRPRQEQPQPQLQTQHTTIPTEATTPPATVPTQSTKPEHQHKYTTEKKAPTCTKEGYTLYTCSCGDTYRSDEKKATGHSWSSWEETQKATTTAAGEKTRTCSVCGKRQTEATSKLSTSAHTHKYTSKVVVEATCTKEGYTRYTCSCGKTYDETIPVRSHLYGNWKVTVQPTETSEGKKEAKCERCGHTKTKTIDKLTAEEGETYEKYIDPRIEIKKAGGRTRYYYYPVSVIDARSWGDPPAIRITNSGGFSVTYLKKNGSIVKVNLDPIEGHVRRMVIQSDGSYTLSVIGDFKD